VDALDLIDARRHDSEAILQTANAYATLSEAKEEEHPDLWEYAAMDAAQHPFVSLLPEAHNATCIVRDLDGILRFLWQESPSSDRWLIGPLCRQHLIDIEEVEQVLEDDPEWLRDQGIAGSADDLAQVLSELPDAPGPLMSF
jgi:hypothetical protein